MKLSVFYPHIAEACEQTGMSDEEVLYKISGFGISAVELDYDAIGDKVEMKKRLDKAGLGVSSVYCFFDFGNFYDEERANAFIDMAEFFGAQRVLCVAGFIHENDNRQEMLDRMTENLNRLCNYAKTKNIVVTMEDFDDKIAPFSTAEGLKYFMDRVPMLRVTFDTGNFMYSDIDELSAFDLLEDKIAHVHCKDRSFEIKTGETPKMTLSGKAMYSSSTGGGVIRIAEIIKRLTEIDYDGYLAIEHFGSQNQLADIEKSAGWLKSVLFNLMY